MRTDRTARSLLLGSGGGLLLGLLLKSRLGFASGVEREIATGNITDRSDISGAGKVSQETPGDRSINLELFHDSGARDHQNLWHLRADLVESILVEEHLVVKLVLNLGLGPGLLLSLGSLGLVRLGALGSGCSLIFSRLLIRLSL